MMHLKATLLFLALQINGDQKLLLDVKVTNIKDGRGFMEVCLFQTPESFLKKSKLCDTREVLSKEDMAFQFEELPAGHYAVSITQDVNGNGKFDLGFLKIPKEPYGFSNNPRTTFGPPSFEEATLDLTQNTSITIEL